jgi:hypothetical protein
MKRTWIAVSLSVIGLVAILFASRLMIRESGHGFPIGDQIVLCEYGYSRGGDRLHWAIIRTFPKDSTTQERMSDKRVGRSFLVWPLIRDTDGRMVPVGTDGNVYFFEGEELKTLRVRMNEHTDTVPLDDSKTLDELWAYLQKFRAD